MIRNQRVKYTQVLTFFDNGQLHAFKNKCGNLGFKSESYVYFKK